MTVIRLTLEYDGRGFRGWAAQPGMRTVEGELSNALAEIIGTPPDLSVAGRTDAGVHAWAQVASIEVAEMPAGKLAARINELLPADVAVTEAAEAADGFDARRDAQSRTYCYRVLPRPAPSPLERGRALLWPHQIDLEALERCAGMLVGRHDFTAFTPTDTEHLHFQRHVLAAKWRLITPGQAATEPPAGKAAASAVIEFWIEADAFMRNMVRVLVGTMLEVAGGRRDPDDFPRLLEGAPRERAGETARADGLYLASVAYEGWRSLGTPY
jgi:tRNA pseudouridine38-40 synthase